MGTADRRTHARRRWAARIGGWAAAIGLAIIPAANAQEVVLDWDDFTWIPEGTGNLSETFPVGGGNVTVSFSGNTAGLVDPTSPAINTFNTGGAVPPERSLYVATDYPNSSNPQVTVFFDFDYPNGVGVLRFNVFDLDGAGTFIDRVRVTACRGPNDTVCEEIRPTTLTPGPVNQVTPPVPPETTPAAITGLLNIGAPFDSDAGNAEFFIDTVGIRRVKLIHSNVIGSANPGFNAMSIHDLSFIPTDIADLSLDKSVDDTNVPVGQQITYTVTVFNEGPAQGTGIEVTDLLPSNVNYVSDDSNGAYNPATGIWRVGDVGVNGFATINIRVSVDVPGTFTNFAEITRSEQADPDSTPGGGAEDEDDRDSVTVTAQGQQGGEEGPTAVDDFDATDIDTPVDIPVLANDIGDAPFQITSVTDPANGTAVIDDNGTPTDTTDDFIVYTPDAGFTGVEFFQYTMRDLSAQFDTANVTVLVGPVFLRLTKRVSPQQALPGGLVQYLVTIENIGPVAIPAIDLVDLVPAGFTYVEGSARLDGLAEGFTVSGARPVVFEDVSFAEGQTRVLTYIARVGAGVGHGAYRNLIAPSPRIGNEASATVVIASDPDFEQTTIIGKVFDDRDADGWQDAGEQGIPGVRLATVEGLLVETDEHGRYHLAGIDGGLVDRGRNFIIKVDPQTLPAGSEFTTENPRVLRITQGLLNRFDFGVRLAGPCCQDIEVKLAEMFFKEGSDEIQAEYFPALADLADRLRQHGGGLLTIEGSAMHGAARVEPVLTQEAKDYVLTPHFDAGRTTLEPGDKAELDRVIAEWRGTVDVGVEAVGHTDSQGIAPENRGEFADNYELSRARAAVVAEYLRSGLGLEAGQVSIDGRGPDQPVADNASAEGRAANRRVELRISGRKPVSKAGAAAAAGSYDRDLADRRAQRVYQALRRLLGEPIMRNVDFQITWSDGAGDAPPAHGEDGTVGRTSFAPAALPRALLDLVIPPAYGQDAAVQDCAVEECRTEDGYAVRILSRTAPRPPAANDTHYAREGSERVDISGRFSARLPGGGDVWAVEDPTRLEPRLALDAPELLPVVDGRIARGARFYIYSNYPALVQRGELLVHRVEDADRVAPLAVVPIERLQGFMRIGWDGQTSEPVEEGDELAVILRVYDAEGRFDETRTATIALVNQVDYEAAPSRELVRGLATRADEEERPVAWRERAAERAAKRGTPAAAEPLGAQPYANVDGGADALATAIGDTPLHGKVMVFHPDEIEVRLDTEVYTLTPRFDTLKTDLKAHDRAELDRIVKAWSTATEVRIEAVGHTDNVPIALEHTHIFKDNYELAQARAWSVVNYLKDGLGVTVSQVNASGRGPDEPVASNRVEQNGRELNRRVELRITGLRPVERIIEEPSVKIVDPPTGLESNLDYSLEEAENVLAARLANAGARRTAPRAVPPPAGAAPQSSGEGGARSFPGGWSAQESTEVLGRIYGTSQLALQTIPMRATLVRIHGIDVRGSHSLYIDGDPVPLDSEGKFAVEYLMPIGAHSFTLERTDATGVTTGSTKLPVELTGKYMFLVALADVTFSDHDFNGSLEPVANEDRYTEDFLVEGRLAFYLKGKVQGKYLLTAQLDSQEEELDDLFGNLDEKDPRAVFRHLDPDRYYPVYGDDSTTVSDTDSMGRFYVRLDWDRSQAVLGNYNTGFTGTEFAQYDRSLYGAKYHHVGTNITAHGEPRSEGQVFVSEVQTAYGHSEFSGTGGSVYYLRHRDIVQGSEKAHVEVLDRDSGRVVQNVELQRGIDYEVDELEGRLILSRPLAQIAPLVGPDIIKDEPLDGNSVRLLVDYEYVPDGFSDDNVAYGGRGRYWINDHIAVGGTLVEEERDAEDYQLAGGDLILRQGRGSYLKLEYAESDSTQAQRFLSSDGGLSFAAPGDPIPDRTGEATGVEARINTKEWLGTEKEWIGGAWYRETDGSFSIARRDLGVDTDEYGMQLSGALGERFTVSGTASVVERDSDLQDERLSLQADYRLGERHTVSGEVRQVNQDQAGDGSLAGMRYTYRLRSNIDLYGAAQTVIDDDDGAYEDNALGTVGARMRLSDHTALSGEVSSGDRGDGASVTVDHRIGSRHWVYGTYTHSTDFSDRPLRGPELGSDSTFALSRRLSGDQIALGHRSTISNQVTMFNEARFEQDRSFSGLAHVFGLDFAPAPGWAVGLSLQSGELAGFTGGIERDAAGIGLGYQNARMRWNGRVEYRNDNGATDARQWLSSNRFDYKLNDDWRILAKANWSETVNQLDAVMDATFIETSFGLAYRPVVNDRLNVLSKITYLYDLPSFAQVDGGTDQRSFVVSAEGVYRLSHVWEVGGKLAHRESELRTSRSTGDWFDSTADFAALRGRYALIRKWDALVEYRALMVEGEESIRQGWLAAIDRHIGEHMQLGIGYNFTDFSDDLTDLEYDDSGWFLNALGKY